MKNFLINSAVTVAFFAAVLYATSFLMTWSCNNRWADSGMKSRWGWTIYCQISPDGVRWIPEDHYREVNQ